MEDAVEAYQREWANKVIGWASGQEPVYGIAEALLRLREAMEEFRYCGEGLTADFSGIVSFSFSPRHGTVSVAVRFRQGAIPVRISWKILDHAIRLAQGSDVARQSTLPY